MKSRKYIYIIPPVIGLVAFVAFFWNWNQGYVKLLEERAAAAERVKEDELRAQNKLRERAIQEAIATQERRKRERLEKEAADRKRLEDRQSAYQVRDKAENDEIRLKEKVDRLAKEVETAKDQIAKIEFDMEDLRGEAVFLQQFTEKAQENVRSLTTVLDKIASADAAAAAAAKAAAAAAAKKS